MEILMQYIAELAWPTALVLTAIILRKPLMKLKKISLHSLTGVNRTCLKNSIFGVFWLVILARRQPSFVFRTKIYSKIQVFQVEEFFARRFLIE